MYVCIYYICTISSIIDIKLNYKCMYVWLHVLEHALQHVRTVVCEIFIDGMKQISNNKIVFTIRR